MFFSVLLTGNEPFHGLPFHVVIREISEGRRPVVPTYAKGTQGAQVIELMELMWHRDVSLRPKAKDVTSRLLALQSGWVPPLASDGIVELAAVLRSDERFRIPEVDALTVAKLLSDFGAPDLASIGELGETEVEELASTLKTVYGKRLKAAWVSMHANAKVYNFIPLFPTVYIHSCVYSGCTGYHCAVGTTGWKRKHSRPPHNQTNKQPTNRPTNHPTNQPQPPNAQDLKYVLSLLGHLQTPSIQVAAGLVDKGFDLEGSLIVAAAFKNEIGVTSFGDLGEVNMAEFEQVVAAAKLPRIPANKLRTIWQQVVLVGVIFMIDEFIP